LSKACCRPYRAILGKSACRVSVRAGRRPVFANGNANETRRDRGDGARRRRWAPRRAAGQ
jgi:hypothetical protein